MGKAKVSPLGNPTTLAQDCPQLDGISLHPKFAIARLSLGIARSQTQGQFNEVGSVFRLRAGLSCRLL